jgi:hypothetical protein
MALKKALFILLLLLFAIFIHNHLMELSACVRCDLLAERFAENDSPPEIIKQTPLFYPQELQDAAVMGTVILDVTVLPDSTVGYIEVKESVPELDSLAIYNISQWDFAPAFREDEPVIGVLTVELSFIPEIFEEAAPDTLYFDSESLTEMIDDTILKRQEPLKHSLSLINRPIYNENYHLISWEHNNRLIRRDAFTLIPSVTLPHHQLQNYYPFYSIDLSEHSWSFRSREYLLPVTYIEAYAGLGFLDMDYAHIDLAKNNSFNVENLQVRAVMFFQDGYWMGVREKSSNFAFGVVYPFGSHTLRWNSLYLDQDIPPLKFRDQHEYTVNVSYEEKLTEHSLLWENNYLNAGLRYEVSRFRQTEEEEQPERTLYQLLLSRDFKWRQHRIEFGWEYFDTEETENFSSPFLTDKHKDIRRVSYGYDGNRLKLSSEIFAGLNFTYHTHSRLDYRFSESLSGNIGVLESSERSGNHFTVRTVTNRDLYAGLQLDSSIGRVKLGGGQREYVQYGLTYHYLGRFLPLEENLRRVEEQVALTTPYLQSEYNMIGQSWGVTEWLLSGSLQGNLRDELDYFPRWFGNTNLECRYNLLHHNALTAGLNFRYTSGFYTPYNKVEATNTLDGYLRISITRLFDIQADAKNLLDTDTVYGYPVAGVHWNVGIRWFFFN